MVAFHFVLPVALEGLIASGKWPGTSGPLMTEQQWKPLISPDRVRLFAPEETLICLHSPPFRSIAQYRDVGGAGEFWEVYGSLDQIDPVRTLVIGDFGMGSDSPIILDYAASSTDPSVRRLRWLEDRRTVWETGAVNFETFAKQTGLLEQ